MIKLVICDVDGTIFCNEKNLWRIENGIAEKIGGIPVTHKEHRRHWYKPTKERLGLTYPGICTERFFKRLMEKPPDQVKSGGIDTIGTRNIKVLENLKGNNKRLALLTSRNIDEMPRLLAGECRLDKWFEKIYHCGNLEHLKPDPKVFNPVLNYFHIQPSEAVYVGDLESDGVCAKKAGLEFIAVLEEGIKNEEDFKHVAVNFFALKFPDILDYIK